MVKHPTLRFFPLFGSLLTPVAIFPPHPTWTGSPQWLTLAFKYLDLFSCFLLVVFPSSVGRWYRIVLGLVMSWRCNSPQFNPSNCGLFIWTAAVNFNSVSVMNNRFIRLIMNHWNDDELTVKWTESMNAVVKLLLEILKFWCWCGCGWILDFWTGW